MGLQPTSAVGRRKRLPLALAAESRYVGRTVASFSIEVLSADPGRGKIVIGDFVECFELALVDWSEADYRLSWRHALTELLADVPAVALMTWCARPGTDIVRRGWTLHRENDALFVQERLFLPDAGRIDLDPTGRVLSVGPREATSDDGGPISTWVTDLTAVREFLHTA